MVMGIKSTRFTVDGAFRRIIKPESRLTHVKELDDGEDEWITDEHRIPLKRLLERYGSNIIKGLEPNQVALNRLKYGSNTFEPRPKGPEIFKIVKSFVFGLNSLIWLCSILSLITYGIRLIYGINNAHGHLFIFGLALVLVIIISGLSFFYEEYKSARIMESFNDMMGPHFAMVKRDGHFKEIYADEVVVGDLVKLTYGVVIPADIRLIECTEFYVDNSSLTGESDPQRRTSICTDSDPMETKNLVFFSTHAVEGHAKGIVTAVGANTVMGKMAELTTSVTANEKKSPIVSEMERFIKSISIRSLVIGIFFSVLSIIMGFSWHDAIKFFTELIVASVPEGLTLTCTTLLVFMAKRMAKKNCLVKNLHSLETLGSASVICTDKTGTLTQNRMSIAHLWFNDLMAEADTSDIIGMGKTFDKIDPGFKALARVARLCSRAKFKQMQADLPIFRREVNGDASEAAILRFMEAQIGNVKKYRSRYKKLCEIPFTSRTKYEGFVHEIKENDLPVHLVTLKGAPEKVLSLCNRILIGEQEYPLDDKWKNKYERALRTLGSLGERVIGFADGLLPWEKYNDEYIYTSEKPEFINVGLRFVGLMSMIDPPRAAVPAAIAKCRSAGVRVVMITGDHPTTAMAIGRVVGVISEGSKTLEEVAKRKQLFPDQISPANVDAMVITGSELKHMDSTVLNAAIISNKELIFARTTPEQKYFIVEAFQRLGHFVAVVGDGVNDSPALKKADIAVSMGITGTEVSKAISDLILLDDNFTTVAEAIEEGRRGFENLKKILAYTLADNIAEMYSFCLCIILRIPLPLGTMAILLTVLCTDIFPAFSLMYETPERDVMKVKPRNTRTERLITPQLLSHTYGQVAVLEVAAGLFSYFATMASHGFMPWTLIGIRNAWESEGVNDLEDSYGQQWTYNARKNLQTYCQTGFFVAIVIMQIANVIICKTRRQSILQKKMNNWVMNIAILVEIAICCGIVYIQPISWFLGMMPLMAIDWLYPIPFAILLIVLDELRRLFVRRNKEGWSLGEILTV